MPQGVALVPSTADHNFSASPHIESNKRCFAAAGVISDDFHPTAFKSSHQFPHDAGVNARLTAMEWQHDDKSQDIQHDDIMIMAG